MQHSNTIVTNEELDAAWGNANFGDTPKREVLKDTLLKCVCGYSTGKTAKAICEELGLITMIYKITLKGQEYLYFACTEK